jgi:NAD(P)-dependent dehydrogenase (short-subunit alcohol dehydrogenase family)
VAKLLVIGASRGIGLETVRAALRAGDGVRALARSASTIPIQNPGLHRVSGDALDRVRPGLLTNRSATWA